MATALPNAMTSSVRSFFARRRFRPRLVPTLAMIVFVAVAIPLGNWQRHRAEEKDALAARVAAASREPPLDLPAVDDTALALRYHAVRAAGRYDAAHPILIDNKVRAGRPGFDVVTPLELGESRRYVLVDRGWIAQGASRRELPQVPVPSGNVTVVGRVDLPPQHYLELSREHAPGPLWENLDVRRIAAATGLDLLPVIVEQTDPAAPGDALLRDWPPPDVGSQQNFSYMLQWYSFATLAFVLWVALNWRQRGSRDGG